MSEAEPPKRPPEPFMRIVPRLVPQQDVLDRLGVMHEAIEARSANLDRRLQAEAEHREVTDRRLEAFHGELSLLRGALTGQDAPPRLEMLPERSPLQKAAGGALAGAKYGALIVGVLGIAVQVASIWMPKLVGPLQAVVQMLGPQ